MKDLDSNGIIGLLINKTIPLTLYDSLLTFRDTDEKFEMDRDFWKTITRKNYGVDLAKLPDKTLSFEFGKKMYFDDRVIGCKILGLNLLKVYFNNLLLEQVPPENQNQKGVVGDFYLLILNNVTEWIFYYKRKKLKNSNKFNEKIVAIFVKLLEYKCISTKQPIFFYFNV